MKKSALVLGGTGLVGFELLKLLSKSGEYEIIKAIVRKGSHQSRESLPGVRWIELESLAEMDRVSDEFKVEHLFCALGSTIKKAGSQAAFREVDVEYPVRAANLGAQHGIAKMMVVSSVGADVRAAAFYLRAKGEMEQRLGASGIPEVYFMRPSFLLGQRREKRFLEGVMTQSLGWLSVHAKKIKNRQIARLIPIEARQVAKVMIEVALLPARPGVHIYEGNLLHSR